MFSYYGISESKNFSYITLLIEYNSPKLYNMLKKYPHKKKVKTGVLPLKISKREFLSE